MEELRLRYSKTGDVKYISHLDIMRCFARAFSRAGIPIWHTEGFNPHPYMNFSPPLPLGVESENEFVDIRLVETMDYGEIAARLNETLPRGIEITGAYGGFMPQTAIAFADYKFEIGFNNNAAAAEKLKAALQSDDIPAEKKKKKGKRHIITQINLKDKIVESKVEATQSAVVISARLKSGGQENLNPVLLFDTLINIINEEYQFHNIRKTALFDGEYKEFQ